MQSNNFTIFHYKEIDSTQKEIWRRVKNKTIKDKTMIIADIQTAGIGTHGRTWHTDEENNIAFSTYLEANCKIEDIANLTIDIAKNIVKTFKEITKLEKNEMFVYESVPGTVVEHFKKSDELVTFTVSGETTAQITLELEPETEYVVYMNEINVGDMTTNLGGKLSISAELAKESVDVKVIKK